jgi:hypothetical protein
MTQRLTGAQKRVIDDDNITWEGWDAKGRPVVGALFRMGFRQPLDSPRDGETQYRRWALLKNGDAADITDPVDRRTL